MSAGVGGGFPGVIAGTLPEGVASALVILMVVRWMFANSRRHVRKKCFATGLSTEQTGMFSILTETRLLWLPRSRFETVKGVHSYGERETHSCICPALSCGGAPTVGRIREGIGL